MYSSEELEAVFSQAVELPDPHVREDFLAKACGDDPQLRRRVHRLLQANDRLGQFMDEPATVFKLPGGAIDEGRPLVGEQPGDTLDDYRLKRKLGEGGMGTVFLATQERPVRREVAIKIVKPGLDTAEVIARFSAEREALAGMRHPHLAKVLDAGSTPLGRPYFVMEYVDGQPITDYCRAADLPLRDRLRLFVLVCGAVQHAHHKGIIHRDIKPSNILVREVDGQPVPTVIDFGIAKAVDPHAADPLLTRRGEFLGTPAYMSPEQANAGDVDTRSDVYSLGALLYEILVGTPPFEEAILRTLSYDEIRKLILEQDPVVPSSQLTRLEQASQVTPEPRMREKAWHAALSGDLDWIVLRALAKDCTGRYDTVSALAEDVTRYLQGAPVVARPPSWSYRLAKLARRHRSAALATALVAATLVAATVLSLRSARDARQAAEDMARAQQQAANEAASLQAVVDFLNEDLFRSASPRSEPDRGVRLRTIVDRAAQRLEQRTFADPRVEFALRSTIGDTYTSLGEFSAARQQLQRARELASTLFAAEDPRALQATNRWITVLLYQEDLDAAEALVTTNRQRAEELLGETDAITIRARNLEAWWLELSGDTAASEAQLNRVLQSVLEEFGPESKQAQHAWAHLASIYLKQGRHDEAFEHLGRAYAVFEQADEGWSPERIQIAGRLASLHLAREELAAADRIYEEVIVQAEAWLGEDHLQTATLQHGQALVRIAQRQPAQAQQLLEKAQASLQSAVGLQHSQTISAMRNLGQLARIRGDAEEAVEWYRQAYAAQLSAHGSQDAITKAIASNLAFQLADQGHAAEAAELYQGLWQQRGDTPDQDMLGIGVMLAVCRLQAGALEEARDVLLEVQSITAAQQSWMHFAVRSQLGEVLHRLGQESEAEKALMQGYEGLRGADVPRAWQPLGMRAALRRLVSFYQRDPGGNPSLAERFDQELTTLLQGESGDASDLSSSKRN